MAVIIPVRHESQIGVLLEQRVDGVDGAVEHALPTGDIQLGNSAELTAIKQVQADLSLDLALGLIQVRHTVSTDDGRKLVIFVMYCQAFEQETLSSLVTANPKTLDSVTAVYNFVHGLAGDHHTQAVNQFLKQAREGMFPFAS